MIPIIIIILVHLVFVFSKWPNKKTYPYWESRKDFAERRIVYLGNVLKSLPWLAYFVYSVHCVRAGGCEAFAWFQMVPVSLLIYTIPFIHTMLFTISFTVYHFFLARCMRTGGCGAFAWFHTALIAFLYFFAFAISGIR